MTMRTLTELLAHRDQFWTEHQIKFLDPLIVKAARPHLQARRIFGAEATVFINDPSKINVEWSESTGMSKAHISLMGEDEKIFDRTKKTQKVIQTKVIEKGYELPFRLSTLTELEAGEAEEAGEQVGIAEDEYLAIGGDGDKGLLNASGIQSFTANPWGAGTDAAWEARVNDVLTAREKLQNKGHYGPKYQLIVNPAEHTKLAKVRATAGGTSALKELAAALGGPVEELVVPWVHCPAGKAYLRDPNPLNARLIVGLDLRNLPLPRTGKNARGEAIVIVGLQMRRGTSVVEMLNVA